MSARELIILLLGLAILAIVLRGLYVAIQTRRGHIRLAIDKNIPDDIDLDELELSELPSGGARVKSRAGDADTEGATPQFRLDRAQARAAAMDLEDDGEQIPVLMEAVNLRATASETGEDDDWEAEESFAAAPGARQESTDTETDAHARTRARKNDAPEKINEPEMVNEPEKVNKEINEDLFADEEADPNERLFRNADQFVDEDEDDRRREEVNARSEEDNDDILLDYDLNEPSDAYVEDDPMASVRPDYGEPDSEEEGFEEEGFEEEDFIAETEACSQHEDEDFDEDSADNRYADAADDDDLIEDDDPIEEPELDDEQPGRAAAARFEDSLDEFSLSAGERIGGYERRKPQSQGTLFDTNDESYDDAYGDADEKAEARPPARKQKPRKRAGLGQSLLSALRRDRKSGELAPEKTRGGEGRRQAPSRIPQPEPLTTPGLEASNEELSPSIQEPPRREAERPRQAQPEPPPRNEAPAPPSDVLVINVMARENRVFRGDDLLEALITAGLKFGDMQIFHKRLRGDSKGPIVFSVANILNPGVFDLNRMDEFQTVGISLFLGLPAPMSSQEAFNLMLDTAQHLKSQLDGEMRDDSRNVMTKQTIEHYRERIREIDLRQLKAAGARG